MGWAAQPGQRTIAGELQVALLPGLVEDVVLVTDDDLREAMRFLALRAKVLAEPAGAAAVAGLLSGKVDPGAGPVVAIVTGGNVQPALAGEVLAGG